LLDLDLKLAGLDLKLLDLDLKLVGLDLKLLDLDLKLLNLDLKLQDLDLKLQNLDLKLAGLDLKLQHAIRAPFGQYIFWIRKALGQYSGVKARNALQEYAFQPSAKKAWDEVPTFGDELAKYFSKGLFGHRFRHGFILASTDSA
jgi:hypothetical protein